MRWVYVNGVAYECGSEPQRYTADAGVLWGDRSYTDMRSLDGEDISTRSKHREYMRRHNLTTIDDYRNHWKEAEQRRDAYRQHGIGGATRREDVARAIDQLQRRK